MKFDPLDLLLQLGIWLTEQPLETLGVMLGVGIIAVGVVVGLLL